MNFFRGFGYGNRTNMRMTVYDHYDARFMVDGRPILVSSNQNWDTGLRVINSKGIFKSQLVARVTAAVNDQQYDPQKDLFADATTDDGSNTPPQWLNEQLRSGSLGNIGRVWTGRSSTEPERVTDGERITNSDNTGVNLTAMHSIGNSVTLEASGAEWPWSTLATTEHGKPPLRGSSSMGIASRFFRYGLAGLPTMSQIHGWSWQIRILKPRRE